MSRKIPIGSRLIVGYGVSSHAVTIPVAFFRNGMLKRGDRVKVYIEKS